METTAGLILCALYLVTTPILYRLLRRRPHTGWLASPLNREYLMVAHIALLLAAISITMDGLVF